MKKTTVTMPSITHAIKAKRLFTSSGYTSEIKRATKVSNEGCTHVLIVNGDSKDVISFLNRNRIEYGKLVNNAVY